MWIINVGKHHENAAVSVARAVRIVGNLQYGMGNHFLDQIFDVRCHARKRDRLRHLDWRFGVFVRASERHRDRATIFNVDLDEMVLGVVEEANAHPMANLPRNSPFADEIAPEHLPSAEKKIWNVRMSKRRI